MAKKQAKNPPLQPLRIPIGWKIEWNEFRDVEPKFRSGDDTSWNFDEDLLLISNDRAKVVIDLGWYPSFRSTGSFGLCAVRLIKVKDPFRGESVEAGDWQAPLKKLRTRSKAKVIAAIETWTQWYSEHPLPPRDRTKKA